MEPLAWVCGLTALGFAFALVMSVVLGPYRLGQRRYRSLPELVKHVSGVVGLAPTREDGAYPELGDVAFRGRLASRRQAGIRFFTVSQGSSTTTYVLFTVAADETPDLRIKRETFFHRIGKTIGVTAEIDVGDDAFDRRFLLVTAEPERARRALGPELRATVSKLFDAFAVIELAFREGSLTAELGVGSASPEAYPRILELLDEAARTLDRREVAVPVFEGTRRAIVDAQGGMRCPYCRENLTGDEAALVSCERCRTVLHGACWDEHGSCPVLGCVGRVPERPRARA